MCGSPYGPPLLFSQFSLNQAHQSWMLFHEHEGLSPHVQSGALGSVLGGGTGGSGVVGVGVCTGGGISGGGDVSGHGVPGKGLGVSKIGSGRFGRLT
jgi:hypothetical protein